MSHATPQQYFDLIKKLPTTDRLPVGHKQFLTETNPKGLIFAPLVFECEVILFKPQETQLHYIYSPNGSSPTEKLGETIIPAIKFWSIKLLNI